MTGALLIFGSTFMAVFFLGLQSLNVNQGYYLAAAVTSFFISTGHIALYKFMPDSGAPELAAYYAGGIIGITSSMWFHRRFKSWWGAHQARRRLRKAVDARLSQMHGAPKTPPSAGWPGDTH